jgi:predicted DNA-binding transcriptional regulator AlpA
MSNPDQPIRRIVRGRRKAAAMLGLSEVHLWRKEREGLAPRPFKVVEGGRGIGYWEDELLAYQAARDASRTSTSAA